MSSRNALRLLRFNVGKRRLLLTSQPTLYRLVQRHRAFVPAFGAFLLQLLVHGRRIHAADGFNRTYMLVRAQHVRYPTYFERQEQIQIVLCYFLYMLQTAVIDSHCFLLLINSSISSKIHCALCVCNGS